MKKNVKGFIGLFSGIAAFILIGVALFVPTNPIQGTVIALHGSVNVALALIGGLLGIVAIVFGIMSRKGRDTEIGPRKAGVIVGSFAILIALISCGICSMTQLIADYANGVPGNVISQMDPAARQEIDNSLQQFKTEMTDNSIK